MEGVYGLLILTTIAARTLSVEYIKGARYYSGLTYAEYFKSQEMTAYLS